MLKYVKNVKYKFVGIRDHAMMMVTMDVNEEERRGGLVFECRLAKRRGIQRKYKKIGRL